MPRLKILTILAALLVGGCAGCQPSPGPGPQPGATGGTGAVGPVVTGGSAGAAQGGMGGAMPQECLYPVDQCDRAGCTLAKLGCRRSRTANGTPFTVACHDALLDGRVWPTGCIVAATTCEKAEACR
jgi:hypothetical protein